MKINRENYPEWFIDYAEGRLDGSQQAMLSAFLDDNDDLRAEFAEFAGDASFPDVGLTGVGGIRFPERDALKRGLINASNLDYYLASYVEGVLSDDERLMLESFLASHPVHARDLKLMQLTRLSPDENMVYKGAAGLKRHEIAVAPAAVQPAADAARASLASRARIYLLSYGQYAAAALVLIMAGLFFMRSPRMWDAAQYTGNIPVSSGAWEQPEAVAAAPAPRQENPDPRNAVQQEAETARETYRPAEPSAAPLPPERPSSTKGQVAGESVRASGPAAQQPSAEAKAAETRSRPSAGDSRPAPVLIPSRRINHTSVAWEGGLVQAAGLSQASRMETRNEFAWWDQRERMPEEAMSEPAGQGGLRETGLLGLALNQLQTATGIDAERLSEPLRDPDRPIVQELASRGLNGLGRLAADIFGHSRQHNEQGRKVIFALGDIVEVSRSQPSGPEPSGD